MREFLHKVEHPTLPVDPLFYEDITLRELAAETKNLTSTNLWEMMESQTA